MSLRRLIVGVDFTPPSEVAVARAAEIAAHHGAELILVHAATVPETPEVPASMQPTADAYVKRLRDELAAHRDQLGDVRAHLHGTGVEVSQLIVDRFADDALVEAATETGADLILTGARERSAAARWLLGSVAAKVVRAAPCSVLCARAGDPDRGFSRIVVGTDFSDGAAKALARAVDVAERDATITVVHAVELGAWPHQVGLADSLGVDEAPLRAELAADAARRGEAAIAAFADAPVTLRFRTVDDRPRDALRAVAAEVAADLIVIGGHGRRGLRRWLLGSVAEDIVNDAPCSVLVAR
ncbi:MAG: universal stress protein [Kofleriaceae bacterium]|jgi:nucleotide-binding universal stress UspA family protein|nr:universal stress protein [Kofleriaceae bacterium]MBP9171624.1 universal stress protein [Kofleriaceae bacterium]MBP9858963.1 universal stress protein [Kofleriaceae bacterium]